MVREVVESHVTGAPLTDVDKIFVKWAIDADNKALRLTVIDDDYRSGFSFRQETGANKGRTDGLWYVNTPKAFLQARMPLGRYKIVEGQRGVFRYEPPIGATIPTMIDNAPAKQNPKQKLLTATNADGVEFHIGDIVTWVYTAVDNEKTILHGEVESFYVSPPDAKWAYISARVRLLDKEFVEKYPNHALMKVVINKLKLKP